MTPRFIEGTVTKTNADPKTLNAFYNRTNKKDSFARWYKRYGAI